jgi:hypothetical protein
LKLNNSFLYLIDTDDKLEMLNQGTQIQMNPDYSNVNSSEQYKPTKSSGYIETESKIKNVTILYLQLNNCILLFNRYR